MSHEEAVDDSFFVGENLGFPGGTTSVLEQRKLIVIKNSGGR